MNVNVWVVAEAFALSGWDGDGEDLAAETMFPQARACKDKRTAMKVLREMVKHRVREILGVGSTLEEEEKAVSRILQNIGDLSTRKDPLFVLYWNWADRNVVWKVFKTKVEGIK